MPSWFLPVVLTVVGMVSAVIGFLVKGALTATDKRITEVEAENKVLHDEVRSLRQEIYGPQENNGLRGDLKELDEEIRYQGAIAHWTANVVTTVADKAGVQIRSDRPKRGDMR